MAQGIGYRLLSAHAARRSLLTAASPYARERTTALTAKLARGETAWLLGIGPAGHNSGVALVEVSAAGGVNPICNNEEERYTGIKNCTDFPQHSLAALMQTAAGMGIAPGDIHACVASWDYVQLATTLLGAVAAELPASRILLDPEQFGAMNIKHIRRATRAPAQVGRQFGLRGPMPIVGMRHHGNHAYYSYAVSPFATTEEPVLITVIDGLGDDGAISIYLARGGTMSLLYRNSDIFDSLGGFYSMISSTQGGWTILSSEGRYMGAVAWGDSDRMTNPYYRQLRQIFHFAPSGEIRLNRALANWPRRLQAKPYTPALTAILGPPIPLANMWNPKSLETINRLVKFGEPFRPLASMATLAAAKAVWVLEDGASDDDWNAYSYMVLTAHPRPGTAAVVPAVIHLDNTSRIQIVRPDTDPFTHAYLRAMGRRVGVEVSVNTSLNVAGPVVQTPEQALEALRRTKAMDGIVMIASDGRAFLAWHAVATPPKDGGARLNNWLAAWRHGG